MNSKELGDLLELTGQPRIGPLPKSPVIDLQKKAEKRSKYRAERCQYNGVKFDSKAEMRRYQDLIFLQSAGLIRNLQLQVAYEIAVNHVYCGKYVADFVYEVLQDDWCEVIEDVKGFRTSTYRLKKRLVEAIYGIKITEIKA